MPKGSTASRLRKILDAARRGAKMVKPNRQGHYLQTDGKGKPCSACEVGTILLGLGQPYNEFGYFKRRGIVETCELVDRLAPEVKLICHLGGLFMCDRYFGVGGMVEHLFEQHEWSRGRVARYLEGLVKCYEADAR